MIDLPPAQRPEPIPQLRGIFVTRVRKSYKGPLLTPFQFFQTTLAASRYMGFDHNIVGAELKRIRREKLPLIGAMSVQGVSFITSLKMYQLAREDSHFLEVLAELKKHFRQFFEDGVMSGDPLGPSVESPVRVCKSGPDVEGSSRAFRRLVYDQGKSIS